MVARSIAMLSNPRQFDWLLFVYITFVYINFVYIN